MRQARRNASARELRYKISRRSWAVDVVKRRWPLSTDDWLLDAGVHALVLDGEGVDQDATVG